VGGMTPAVGESPEMGATQAQGPGAWAGKRGRMMRVKVWHDVSYIAQEIPYTRHLNLIEIEKYDFYLPGRKVEFRKVRRGFAKPTYYVDDQEIPREDGEKVIRLLKRSHVTKRMHWEYYRIGKRDYHYLLKWLGIKKEEVEENGD